MINIDSKIENIASEACKLPAFKSLSLLELKTSIADILSFIGREEIFATYTKHDISHVDSMLRIAEWLIPPSTAKEMTSADWLLITLSIYLHDLGMVTTTEEYNNRKSNSKYQDFRHLRKQTNQHVVSLDVVQISLSDFE